MSMEEAHLWHRLRNRLLNGHKFRRQFPVGSYIADFACPEAKLIIEVDGGQHALQREYDAARKKAIEVKGYAVLRFGANDVMQRIEAVLFSILQEVHKRTSINE